jgi:hypothetical protein
VHEEEHSPTYSDEAKNEFNYASTPPTCRHGIWKNNTTFSLLGVQYDFI